MEEKLRLVVRGRNGVVFEDEVGAVSSVSKLGPFDVLPKHARMVAEIKEKVVARWEAEVKEWQIKGGIMWVDGRGGVEIFLGI